EQGQATVPPAAKPGERPANKNLTVRLNESNADFIIVIFFFQAEDGIRAGHVTGVQTCALPIFAPYGVAGGLYPFTQGAEAAFIFGVGVEGRFFFWQGLYAMARPVEIGAIIAGSGARSEERRVGKEGRCGGGRNQ